MFADLKFVAPCFNTHTSQPGRVLSESALTRTKKSELRPQTAFIKKKPYPLPPHIATRNPSKKPQNSQEIEIKIPSIIFSNFFPLSFLLFLFFFFPLPLWIQPSGSSRDARKWLCLPLLLQFWVRPTSPMPATSSDSRWI